jgi:hypothetical protein
MIQTNYRGHLGRRKGVLQGKLNQVQGEELGEKTGMTLRRYHLLRTGAALKIQQWARAWLAEMHEYAALLAKQVRRCSVRRCSQ